MEGEQRKERSKRERERERERTGAGQGADRRERDDRQVDVQARSVFPPAILNLPSGASPHSERGNPTRREVGEERKLEKKKKGFP